MFFMYNAEVEASNQKFTINNKKCSSNKNEINKSTNVTVMRNGGRKLRNAETRFLLLIHIQFPLVS